MELKFKVGDKAIITNHPNKELIGRVVEVKTAGEVKFKEGAGPENQGIYSVHLDGKPLGWAPECDLREFIPSTLPESCADGVYILTIENNCIHPGEWLNHQEQTPVGIAVIEGNKKYVVALKSSPKELQFLPSRETATSNQFNELDQAIEDWNGKGNTVQLVAAGSPAAKYCDEYSCGNIPAGSWYLPAFGEMIFMQNRKNIIDAALTLCGGEPLHYGWHWTSTAASLSSAWLLNWLGGDTYINLKVSLYQVRPISVFLSL